MAWYGNTSINSSRCGRDCLRLYLAMCQGQQCARHRNPAALNPTNLFFIMLSCTISNPLPQFYPITSNLTPDLSGWPDLCRHFPDQKAVHTANGSTCRINTVLLLHPTTPAECMLILLNLMGAYILHVMKSFNQKTALRKHVQHLCFFNFEYFSCVSIY